MDSDLIASFSLAELKSARCPAGWHEHSPTLLCATDDRYTMPLAAAMASVMTQWNANRTQVAGVAEDDRIQLVLLDGGIEHENWQRLSQTLRAFNLKTLRVQADRTAVEHLKISHHISHTAYFRLLSSRWLPEWISRVIYLDCDVIVLGDLRELWKASLLHESNASGHRNEVWAVPDVACPYLDPAAACPNYEPFAPYFATLNPIRNFRELGLDPRGYYFNSGVMVLDLAAWRANHRSEQLLECLRENAAHVWCWDQYALNVVFAKCWGALPLAWNFGAHAYDYAAVPNLTGLSPLLPDQYQEMLDRPKLIHYTTEIKPWHYYSFHPLTKTFFEYLALTPWATWSPPKPGFKTWWHVQTFRWQKQLMAMTRRWRAVRH